MDAYRPIVTYTRAQLQGLKQEEEMQQDRMQVKQMVEGITRIIMQTALTGKTTLIQPRTRPANPEDRQYKVIMATIDELKLRFIDVDIKYDSQTCIRTGKVFNEGIYIDWS